jgi:hypothetical protein
MALIATAGAPALALDPNSTTKSADVSPEALFRTGKKLHYANETDAAVSELERAAAGGHAGALYLLGRIYRNGEGVPQDDYKAFQFFYRILTTHAEDPPGTSDAAFVSGSIVALGGYYLSGIKNTEIKPDPTRARELWNYAATYFGDADAQFHLGRFYLNGDERDPKQAVRWLKLGAEKHHIGAQALFGQLLFNGDAAIPRNPTMGLTWLTIARWRAQSPQDDWIRDLQEQAFSVASEAERRKAVTAAQAWVAKAGSN